MDREVLARELRAARENRGISQQAAAKRAGLSRTLIAQIELGNRPVSADELAKLAAVYRRPVIDLLGEPVEEDDVLVIVMDLAPELVEPTFVLDWPVELSPFAHTTDDDPTLVERFEFVVSGMELGNAFSELNDGEEQARRFAMQEDERAAGDATAEEGDPDYVEALSYGMPPTGGCGIGMDRLAMVLLGRDTIRDVILFPALRARD